jgi:hypothetical protein
MRGTTEEKTMALEKTWETTPEGATRVINPDALIRKNADVFRWVQDTFGGRGGDVRNGRPESGQAARAVGEAEPSRSR